MSSFAVGSSAFSASGALPLGVFSSAGSSFAGSWFAGSYELDFRRFGLECFLFRRLVLFPARRWASQPERDKVGQVWGEVACVEEFECFFDQD